MNKPIALIAASAMALSALIAAAPMASAATGHGLSCKSGHEPMRVMEKGRHVWRCEPMGHHTTMKSHGATAPEGGTMSPQGGGSTGGTSY